MSETTDKPKRAPGGTCGADCSPVIYCYAQPSGFGHDVIVYALAEDGECLASHMSSCELWAQHDIGINSDWKHDAYRAHYPDGYRLEWVDTDKLESHGGFKAAFTRNQENAHLTGPNGPGGSHD